MHEHVENLAGLTTAQLWRFAERELQELRGMKGSTNVRYLTQCSKIEAALFLLKTRGTQLTLVGPTERSAHSR